MHPFQQDCIDFAKRHLSECAAELIERSETGILRNGRVRELSERIKQWAPANEALSIAENTIKRAALEAAVTFH